jgi:hypothetical protein
VPTTQQDEKRKLEKLRSILFAEERAKIERLNKLLDRKDDSLAEKVVPIIDDELHKFEQHFPKTYQLAVDRIIEHKLKQSQDQLLDVLYPIIGKMIRKYLAQQLQELRESVQKQVRQSYFGRFRESVTGVREGDRILSEASASKVEEAYVIEQHSGLLMGSASNSSIVDKDMLAGMLTAIKSFVVDAFQRGDTFLETINYAGYQIIVQDYYTFYVALAVNGHLTTQEYETLQERIDSFCRKELTGSSTSDDYRTHARLGNALQDYFMKTPQLYDQ